MKVLLLNGASGTGKTTTAAVLHSRIPEASWVHPDGIWESTPQLGAEELLEMSLEHAAENRRSDLVLIDCQIRPSSVPGICDAWGVRSWATVLHTCPVHIREERLLRRGWTTENFARVATWAGILLDESLAAGTLVVDTSTEDSEAISDRIVEYARQTNLLGSGERMPGPPERIDGMTVGIVTMEHNAPHGGEVHPDGDEILYVISGRLRVTGDSAPEVPLELGPGAACVVKKGEWHQVDVLEKTQLLHITPGPNGDHRPE